MMMIIMNIIRQQEEPILRRALKIVENDEVLNTMRQDQISEQFVTERVLEIVLELISNQHQQQLEDQSQQHSQQINELKIEQEENESRWKKIVGEQQKMIDEMKEKIEREGKRWKEKEKQWRTEIEGMVQQWDRQKIEIDKEKQLQIEQVQERWTRQRERQTKDRQREQGLWNKQQEEQIELIGLLQNRYNKLIERGRAIEQVNRDQKKQMMDQIYQCQSYGQYQVDGVKLKVDLDEEYRAIEMDDIKSQIQYKEQQQSVREQKLVQKIERMKKEQRQQDEEEEDEVEWRRQQKLKWDCMKQYLERVQDSDDGEDFMDGMVDDSYYDRQLGRIQQQYMGQIQKYKQYIQQLEEQISILKQS